MTALVPSQLDQRQARLVAWPRGAIKKPHGPKLGAVDWLKRDSAAKRRAAPSSRNQEAQRAD